MTGRVNRNAIHADGEEMTRPLRLRAPETFSRHFDIAQGIVLKSRVTRHKEGSRL